MQNILLYQVACLSTGKTGKTITQEATTTTTTRLAKVKRVLLPVLLFRNSRTTLVLARIRRAKTYRGIYY